MTPGRCRIANLIIMRIVDNNIDNDKKFVRLCLDDKLSGLYYN